MLAVSTLVATTLLIRAIDAEGVANEQLDIANQARATAEDHRQEAEQAKALLDELA